MVPWVPEVSLAGRMEMAAEGRWHCTSAEATRKTSGSERFNSPCSMIFDQFYRIIFKPITARITHCERVDFHVKT